MTEEAVRADFAEVNRQVDAMDSEIDQLAAAVERLGRRLDEIVRKLDSSPDMACPDNAGILRRKK
jgi:ABC-type transporter Mla subunit MlaD